MEKRSFRMGLGFSNFKDKEKKIPDEFKKIAKDFSEKRFCNNIFRKSY